MFKACTTWLRTWQILQVPLLMFEMGTSNTYCSTSRSSIKKSRRVNLNFGIRIVVFVLTTYVNSSCTDQQRNNSVVVVLVVKVDMCEAEANLASVRLRKRKGKEKKNSEKESRQVRVLLWRAHHIMLNMFLLLLLSLTHEYLVSSPCNYSENIMRKIWRAHSFQFPRE